MKAMGRSLKACGLFLAALGAGLALGGSACGQGAAPAGDDQLVKELVKQNSVLVERVQALEARLSTVEQGGAESASRLKQLELLKELKASNANGAAVLSSSFDDVRFKLYGYLKTDAAYMGARANSNDAPCYMLSPSAAGVFKHDGQFSMTARQSRLGLFIDGPKVEGWDVRGRIEADFYNGVNAEVDETRTTPRLRLAYIEISKPETLIRVGEDWDVAAPLNPDTINYGILNYGGNLGYRRVQARLTQRIALDAEKKYLWIVEGSINRPQGEGGGTDEGVDSGLPLLEGRTALRFPGWTKQPIEVGLSGSWSKEEYDSATVNAVHSFASWSANADWSVPLTEQWSWKGEFFTGRNLDQLMGGINQGVNGALWRGIRDTGGWTQLSFSPTDKWTFNGGIGIDNPCDGDLSATMRSYNHIIYANVIYKISKQLQVGLEVSDLKTDYIQQRTGEALRVQGAVWYYF